jgi:glycerol kinase
MITEGHGLLTVLLNTTFSRSKADWLWHTVHDLFHAQYVYEWQLSTIDAVLFVNFAIFFFAFAMES